MGEHLVQRVQVLTVHYDGQQNTLQKLVCQLSHIRLLRQTPWESAADRSFHSPRVCILICRRVEWSLTSLLMSKVKRWRKLSASDDLYVTPDPLHAPVNYQVPPAACYCERLQINRNWRADVLLSMSSSHSVRLSASVSISAWCTVHNASQGVADRSLIRVIVKASLWHRV